MTCQFDALHMKMSDDNSKADIDLLREEWSWYFMDTLGGESIFTEKRHDDLFLSTLPSAQ